MSTVTVRGHSVEIDGKLAATLTYSGRVVSIHQALPPDHPVIGRLIRQSDSQPYRYDAWTALHPATMTPSDRLLGADLPEREAVLVVLQPLVS